MEILIDGTAFSQEALQQWKLGRIQKVLRMLKRDVPATGDADDMMQALTAIKETYTYDQMYGALKNKVRLATLVNKLICTLSGESVCFSRATIRMTGISAKEAADRINEINLNAAHRREYEHANLAACPDHYVLRALPDSRLEVIETTGDSPAPLQFFITYGEETGLQIPRDPACAHQSVGVARLKDGTLIGGVRHQFFDTDAGMEARLAVQFPGRCPKSITEGHQRHLACEFSSWLQWIAAHRESI